MACSLVFENLRPARHATFRAVGDEQLSCHVHGGLVALHGIVQEPQIGQVGGPGGEVEGAECQSQFKGVVLHGGKPPPQRGYGHGYHLRAPELPCAGAAPLLLGEVRRFQPCEVRQNLGKGGQVDPAVDLDPAEDSAGGTEVAVDRPSQSLGLAEHVGAEVPAADERVQVEGVDAGSIVVLEV